MFSNIILHIVRLLEDQILKFFAIAPNLLIFMRRYEITYSLFFLLSNNILSIARLLHIRHTLAIAPPGTTAKPRIIWVHDQTFKAPL